ncbi:MAG: GEVED domain-containing protein [Caldilineaceae bacterium]
MPGLDDAGATRRRHRLGQRVHGEFADIRQRRRHGRPDDGELANMRDGVPGIYGTRSPGTAAAGDPYAGRATPTIPAAHRKRRMDPPPSRSSFPTGYHQQLHRRLPVVVVSSPLRYEWIEVRAYDRRTLIVTDRLTASTHTPPNGVIALRPDSPAIFEPIDGVYQGRGTSEQGSCTDICGYDRFTLAYVTTPLARLELTHFATTGLTVDSGLIGNATSVAVEGFALATPTYDFGDLPEGSGFDYRTTLAGGGPSHIVRDTIFLGATVDAEADGQPTATADGDDVNPAAGPDDEDGVAAAALQLAEQRAVIPVRVTNTTGRAATLYGWIDFDASGTFDQFERAQIEVPNTLVNTDVLLDFGAVPVNNVTNTFARFRLSSDGAAAGPTRPAFDGEVEDYLDHRAQAGL